jgi:hypothetical protein
MEHKVPYRSGSRIESLFGVFLRREGSLPRMFRIFFEFRRGYKLLRKYNKAVSFFGSARCDFESRAYKEAEALAFMLAKDGYAIITGGGPGVMEAANKGAKEVGSPSVGITILLPEGERRNQYVTDATSFRYFFVRKVMLSFASQVYVFFPGGFGTLDEFFEIITLIQTKKIDPIPVVLVDKEYWNPLLEWMRITFFEKHKAIAKEDMEIYTLVSDAQEAYQAIKEIVSKSGADSSQNNHRR